MDLPRLFKIREVRKIPAATIGDLHVVPHIIARTEQRPNTLVRMSRYQIKS
jgi:hypothetical protein